MRRPAVLVAGLMLGAAPLPPVVVSPAFAVEPGEALADQALEARARALSSGLRCMVCQNQSIDDSDAPLAKDLRTLVRRRLQAGDSDDAVIDYVVSRYGEFVLLRPRIEWRTLALWGTPLMLIVAGTSYILLSMRRQPPADAGQLSADEVAALERVLRERGR